MRLPALKTESLAPNLVILGAQKAGTTSLHKYLNHHPDIFMSRPIKEPGFYLDFAFIRDYFAGLGIPVKSKADLLKRYMLAGYRGERYRGESSTYYTLGNRCRQHEVPENIHRTNPATRFLYVLRNPFARIVSAYLHEQRKGRAPVDLDAFTTNEGSWNRDHTSLETSLYYDQLSNYLKRFDPSRIKLIVFEEFIRLPGETLNGIFSFLGVPELQHFPSFKAYNASGNREKTDGEALKFSKPVYDRLLDLFTAQQEKLEDLMNGPISTWDFSPDKWCRN